MGMTIDTVDKWLKIQRQNLVDFPEIGRDKKIESLDTAMSYLEDYQQLLRKYQKIEDIVRDYYNEQYTDKLDIEIIEMISEVLEEDGRWE